MRTLLVLLFFLRCSAATADDIYLAKGRFFSVYVPAACEKERQDAFALALRCKLQGKLVRFYLKELPGQLDEQFDARKNHPAAEHADAYKDAALRSILDELDPEIRLRVKMFSWGNVLGFDNAARFYWDGYVSNADVPKATPKSQNVCLYECYSFSTDTARFLFASAKATDFRRMDRRGAWEFPEKRAPFLEAWTECRGVFVSGTKAHGRAAQRRLAT